MRIVVLLLLLANATLFAYTRLDNGSGEGVRLAQQLQPEKIKLLSPQQVAALGPAKVAALADVCVEWGPFGEAERARAVADLEPLALGRLLTQKRVDVESAYWVSTGPFPNRGAADKRAAELRAQGLRDVTLAEIGKGQYAIGLGAYRAEPAAVARAEELATLGIRTAKVLPKQQTVAQTILVVRDPQQPVVARLRELIAKFPGSDLKVGACERAG
jgi:hypothetical protein